VIPLFRPTVHGDEEAHAVSRVLHSGWWALGPETETFEEEFAAYTGTRYAVAVNSGTMALKLAAAATGLTSGVAVVPALTFISTALAVHQLGNIIVFADVDEADLCLNWYDVRQKLSAFEALAGPRGVIPVWYGGHVDTLITEPLPACTRVIEDCAHAAGADMAGKVGRAAAWSFHAVKNLAPGDGGMVTTDDEYVAREVRRMRWVGIDKSTWDRDKDAKVGYGWDYDIRALDGEKAHMNDIQAAIGRVQLAHLDEDNARRRAVAEVYHQGLAGLGWLSRPYIRRDDSAHLYVARVPTEHRDRFIAHMISGGVSAGVHYKPLTHYADTFGRPLFGPQAGVPVTERVWQTLVTLPLFPSMTEYETWKVVETVRSFPA
jgi:perosamine synthetase